MNAAAGGEADEASLKRPRHELGLARAFQWLNEDGHISLLLSPDGR
jgi:hypothetical protein